MKILNITAQKPNSTGSGVYATELIRCFHEMGHDQVVVAGIDREDQPSFPDGISFYPVCFRTEALPYPVVGMSDEMPYESTRYCDLTEEMVAQFQHAFLSVIEKTVEDFDPDVILCHHLYLLTAFVREQFPKRKVVGFCHNTDLRQMVKTDLMRPFIKEQIQKLDAMFVSQEIQRGEVLRIFDVKPEQITVIGTAYNPKIFYRNRTDQEEEITRLVFAGKVAEKKGAVSLMRALKMLPISKGELCLTMAGGAGNTEEYAYIRELAKETGYAVSFPGRLSQSELAKVYNESDIFVLPSFFDTIPLVAIEAMDCGCRVVLTDLPGVQDWLKQNVKHADIRYVSLPPMERADEPVKELLPAFEKELAETLLASIEEGEHTQADVSEITWEALAGRVMKTIQ